MHSCRVVVPVSRNSVRAPAPIGDGMKARSPGAGGPIGALQAATTAAVGVAGRQTSMHIRCLVRCLGTR